MCNKVFHNEKWYILIVYLKTKKEIVARLGAFKETCIMAIIKEVCVLWNLNCKEN
jgi:hypothetical protein